MAAYRQVYDSLHLQADYKNRDQLRNPTFGNRVLAIFTFLLLIIYFISEKKQSVIHLPTPLENAPH